MVNVTKDNFISESNELLKHLPTAAFVAIDEEMTGISVTTGRPIRDVLPGDRYAQELKQPPEKYNIIQLGICLFHLHTPESTGAGGRGYSVAASPRSMYKARRYNIYMFPAAAGWNEKDQTDVIMSPSAVAFLTKNGMSFDTWMSKGVPYVNSTKAQELLSSYIKKGSTTPKKKSDMSVIELSRADDITFCARAMASIREWMDNAQEGVAMGGGEDGAIPEEGISYFLPNCNSYLRRALYGRIAREYPMLVAESVDDRIRVTRLNKEEREAREDRLQTESWESFIRDKVGAWRVFDALRRVCNGETINPRSALFAESYKQIDWSANEQDAAPSIPGRRMPIVVHHGFMDLCFLLTHFHSPQLPPTLRECKELIRSHFPVIYDTKVLASESMVASRNTDQSSRGTSVAQLFRTMVREPYGEGEPFFNRIVCAALDEGEQEHEAAYDAFMTGCIFGSIMQHIKVRVPNITDIEFDHDSDEARFHLHRNYIYQMSIFTMDLEEGDLYAEPLARGMTTSTTFQITCRGTPPTRYDIDTVLSGFQDSQGVPVRYEVVLRDSDKIFVGVNCRNLVTPTLDRLETIAREHGHILQQALTHNFRQAKVVDIRTLLSHKAFREKMNGWVNSIFGSWTTPTREASDDIGSERQRKRQRIS